MAMVLTSNFVQKHLMLAKPKDSLGKSSFTGRHETNLLLHKERRMDTNRLFSGYKFRAMPFGPLRDIDPSSWQSVRSCNFGAHTADIMRIGGFDESYVGWGREDSDFVTRMLKAGITVRSGRFATCVAHLFHPERSRDQFSVNDDKFKSCYVATRAINQQKLLSRKMKISGFTFHRNADINGYPFIESIRSVLPLVDEFAPWTGVDDTEKNRINW